MCFDIEGWSDSGGGDCAWYGRPVGDDDYYYEDNLDQFARCNLFGADYENMGFVANEACCHCGGGVRPRSPSDTPTVSSAPTVSAVPTEVNCYDFPGWYGWGIPRYNCAWFANPVNNDPDDDYYGETDTRCSRFGDVRFGVDAEGNTASAACCVCGK